MLKAALLVGSGSFIGGVCRYLLGVLLKPQSGSFPTGTFVANVLGCLLIGLFYGYSAKNPAFSKDILLLLTTGLCGGFTTFSTFSNESLTMLQGQHYGMFALYVGLSIAAGLTATFIGYLVTR